MLTTPSSSDLHRAVATAILSGGSGAGAHSLSDDEDTQSELSELDAADDHRLGSSAPNSGRSTPRPLTAEEQAEVAERMLTLMEFYFGDSNYPKDKFLRRQAREDPLGEGWIGVDVITSFKKVRKISKEPAVALAALAAADAAELSADETRVRRRHPLPPDPVEMPFRTVILQNLPAGLTAEAVRPAAEHYGKVLQIRLVDPVADGGLPEDMQAHVVKIQQVASKKPKLPHPALRADGPPFVLVEYATIEAAVEASERLDTDRDLPGAAPSAAAHAAHAPHSSIHLAAVGGLGHYPQQLNRDIRFQLVSSLLQAKKKKGRRSNTPTPRSNGASSVPPAHHTERAASPLMRPPQSVPGLNEFRQRARTWDSAQAGGAAGSGTASLKAAAAAARA